MTRRFGVDEAGKGPVLGSMFAAAVVCDPADLPAGVRDSKRLSPARRDELDAAIRDVADVGVAEVTVEEIDAPETDMNTLTVAAHARALAAVDYDGLAGVVDGGDVDAARFGRRVASRLDGDVDVVAEHGADDAHEIVGAASVVAKVARDDHVAALAEEYGDVGSGYPGDERTMAFLREHVSEHGTLPDPARESWRTCDDVLAAASQSALDDF
ncbi:ribonuclease HII [Halarchaeum nitratireducens]|uniref:Ribonuclease HII n=1 Tax=Halarchaeum nitratireducens TaxID=489913 RepID=A0A830G770_9EURY|nr:ribonuclease HII [Halarchaeum nitratireducens]GGN06902.1 ribonuclease HII [Halarchaeum nitratireducens]